MENDSNFVTQIENPSFPLGSGPKVTVDGGHNNFFVSTGLIKPLLDLLESDGYTVEIANKKIDQKTFFETDIFLVITPMSSHFAESADTFLEAFSKAELEILKRWVQAGGRLLVFSEHYPFDVAVSGLLETFGITTSIGVTIDKVFSGNSDGNIIFEADRLDASHPIVSGKRQVNKLASYGGSALKGSEYTNVLRLSKHSTNASRNWAGVDGGPIGSGNSQGLVGLFGKGRLAAFGDSNGFSAMVFLEGDLEELVGMNDKLYDWRNFVLNTFDWLSEGLVTE